MMANHQNKIQYQNIQVYSMQQKKSIKIKDYQDCIKDFISVYSVRLSLFLYFSGCTFYLYQVRYEKRKIYYNNMENQTEKKNNNMDSVMYASIQASIFSTFVTQPFWVIRTRMLLDVSGGKSEIQNFIDKTRQISNQNGIKGFGKGLMLSLILSFSGVIQMYIYQASKLFYDYANLPQTFLQQKNFICGGFSKIFSILLSYPITTVRTRIQQNQYFNNRNNAKYSNILQIIERIIKQQNIKGFYKGLSANLIRGIPQKGIYFYTYEILKKILIINNNQDRKNNQNIIL